MLTLSVWLLFLKIELGIYALIRWDLVAIPPRPHDTHQSAVQSDVMDAGEFNENTMDKPDLVYA